MHLAEGKTDLDSYSNAVPVKASERPGPPSANQAAETQEPAADQDDGKVQ